MSTLDTLLSGNISKTTTLPSWYDQAQQEVLGSARSALGNVPGPGQSVAQGAFDMMKGSSNPFTQAAGVLNKIATGAANPWIVDASGNVTPDTSTALGGLFAAQNKQLQTLLPSTLAPAAAGSIAGGNFGSLRGATAEDTALTNAQTALASAQMQAALQGQQIGQQAASALSNVGAQDITATQNLAGLESSLPFAGATNYANIVNAMKAPESVTSSQRLPLVGQIGGLQAIGATGKSILDAIMSGDWSKVLTGQSNTNTGALNNTQLINLLTNILSQQGG